MRVFCMLLLAGLLAGCARPADPDEAEQAVPQFHMALMEKDFAGIYQRADAALRADQSQDAFVAYLQKQQARLGEVRGANRTATQVKGREVTLTYASDYAGGMATEEFVVRQEEGLPPQIVSYRLLSPALP